METANAVLSCQVAGLHVLAVFKDKRPMTHVLSHKVDKSCDGMVHVNSTNILFSNHGKPLAVSGVQIHGTHPKTKRTHVYPHWKEKHFSFFLPHKPVSRPLNFLAYSNPVQYTNTYLLRRQDILVCSSLPAFVRMRKTFYLNIIVIHKLLSVDEFT